MGSNEFVSIMLWKTSWAIKTEVKRRNLRPNSVLLAMAISSFKNSWREFYCWWKVSKQLWGLMPLCLSTVQHCIKFPLPAHVSQLRPGEPISRGKKVGTAKEKPLQYCQAQLFKNYESGSSPKSWDWLKDNEIFKKIYKFWFLLVCFLSLWGAPAPIFKIFSATMRARSLLF